MTADFLYENAPLIEVIAEMRWAMTPLASMPGNFIDPYFDATSEEFIRLAKESGFGAVERLVPEPIPLELVAGQPIYRFRQKSERWPLYQLGPGVFTANIIPKYSGWAAFRAVISEGLSLLEKSFPNPDKLLRVEATDLRYVDAFTEAHGLEKENFSQFAEEHLGLKLVLRDGLLDTFAASSESAVAVVEFRVSAKSPANTDLIIKASPGRKTENNGIDVPALIVELRAASKPPKQAFARDKITDWMDEAHELLRNSFEHMSSEHLKEKMGPRQAIGS